MASTEEINELLPQTQCKMCGYPNCLGYARGIIDDNASIDLCPPGGESTRVRLAAIMGVALSSERVLLPEPKKLFALIDEESCIGCTKCLVECPTDAIIGAKSRVHTTVEKWCTGCGLCVPVCPVDCIEIKDKSEDFLTNDYRLACQAKINIDTSDIKFNVLRRQPKILEEFTNNKIVLNSKVIIKNNFVFDKKNNIVLSEKVTPIYGIAADIGTTTVACSLIDLGTGKIIGISSFENPQRFGGSDTLNRISYETTKYPGELQAVIISGLNFEIGELCKKNKIRRSHIYEMVIVGNTNL